MTKDEWEDIIHRAWDLYYSEEHVETLFRRAVKDRIGLSRLDWRIVLGHCAMKYENVHPFQMGVIRRKVRKLRRRGMPRENAFVFYPRRAWETARTGVAIGLYLLKTARIAKRVKREVVG